MKHHYLFKPGKTNTTSRPFGGRTYVAGFNMAGEAFDVDEDGALTGIIEGDVVYFERLLYDGVYDIDCSGIDEKGVIASEPLRDECGCVIVLSACHNVLRIDEPGVFRAIYEGGGRDGASVVFYQED